MQETSNEFDIGHPAPNRGKISGWSQLLALAAAPLAWAGQISLNGFIALLACTSGAGVRQWTPGWQWAETGLRVINLLALAARIAGLGLATYLVHKTDPDEIWGSGGLMDAGEGRTHFVSVWGAWGSLLFIIAIAFNTVAVFWRGLCHG